jgi:hypothetical protein
VTPPPTPRRSPATYPTKRVPARPSLDKESVEDAREEYREALEGGDHEDVEHAREVYEELLEDNYEV